MNIVQSAVDGIRSWFRKGMAPVNRAMRRWNMRCFNVGTKSTRGAFGGNRRAYAMRKWEQIMLNNGREREAI